MSSPTTGEGSMWIWQQAGGHRHAREATSHSELPEGQTFVSLCGETLTVLNRDVHGPNQPGWLDPTCVTCDLQIRVNLGLPLPRCGTDGAGSANRETQTRRKMEAH
ncbi:zinc finger protein [Amycolatopsis sp. NPDC051373]|uniref:zinc finger protein n=1 Tax=Amycolatopsis sp. NPDC051373 TaxID=3155801 RepID=UPI00344E9DD2